MALLLVGMDRGGLDRVFPLMDDDMGGLDRVFPLVDDDMGGLGRVFPLVDDDMGGLDRGSLDTESFPMGLGRDLLPHGRG